ncbi:MAG: hypothetical protein A2261_01440 [Candidatus Magasanikbacteria bacterium RIFOXYA2_FULL_44_8]|uniref:Uncharacterized protein n=1 Tax=Candidatus Magasanikbacteria bacterium RIFOXYA2_FULL_44_8 TaxID=1798696 RepID=A0A1F6NL77_9BACT|nr:MAG: hypothetical protein A2261_01440 [Candidatus Magasanikbacteria bacterium RIFOXYA2_FULL_44_8]
MSKQSVVVIKIFPTPPEVSAEQIKKMVDNLRKAAVADATLEIAPEDVRITCLDGHSYEQEVFIEAGVVTKSAQDRNTMNLLADRLLHAVVDAAPDVLVECHMYPITGIAFKRFRPDEQDVENKLPPV